MLGLLPITHLCAGLRSRPLVLDFQSPNLDAPLLIPRRFRPGRPFYLCAHLFVCNIRTPVSTSKVFLLFAA